MRTSPAVGKSIAPARFKRVVFPHPLRPRSAVIVPADAENEMSWRTGAGWPPLLYVLATPRSSRRGGDICSHSMGCRLPARALGLPRAKFHTPFGKKQFA